MAETKRGSGGRLSIKQLFDRNYTHLIGYAVARGAKNEHAREAAHDIFVQLQTVGGHAPPLDDVRRMVKDRAQEYRAQRVHGDVYRPNEQGGQTGKRLYPVRTMSDSRLTGEAAANGTAFDVTRPRYMPEDLREGKGRCDLCGTLVRWVPLNYGIKRKLIALPNGGTTVAEGARFIQKRDLLDDSRHMCTRDDK
jgi:hypothetical protein